MKTNQRKLTTLFCSFVPFLLLAMIAPSARGQNTSIDYLGNLSGVGGPVSGTYDFKFRLFEQEFGSPQIGKTVFKAGVPVQNGSFTVSLDFGVVLQPISYWIEVSVKPAGPGDYVLLLPLQKLSPFATALTADTSTTSIYATTAGSATTSGYATNAGTATYANSSGSSGTSGYATNAGYANTSGTSGYATNAGTSAFATNANFSGYATNAGYANTSGTSGYATNAGTANYANTSGTAGYATNAGTANFANTSGSSGFATNAGFANTAGTAVIASNVVPNSIGTVALQDNSVTGPKIPSGTVVRSLNTLTDHVLLEPGPNIFINATGQTITVSASAGVGGSGWGFSGNTIAGADFLGTLNGEALEFRVNGQRALRLQPAEESHNTLGGHPQNWITNEAVGVVIAGGGNTNGPQQALGSYAVIGGGWSNSAALLSVVSGGWGNQATGSNSVVAGGQLNTAFGQGSVVGGGGRDQSTIFPDYFPAEPNVALGDYSVVSGGTSNTAAGAHAVVGGGRGNLAEGAHSVVAGGTHNTASGTGSVIAGGGRPKLSAFSQAQPNVAMGDYTFIGGGRDNQASAEEAVVSGGYQNRAKNNSAAIGGGAFNTASGAYATVGGGQANEAIGDYSVIPGGGQNLASGNDSFAAGRNARAVHPNSFVWSDGQNPTTETTAPSQFVVSAAGGVRLVSDTGLSFEQEGSIQFGGNDRDLITFPGDSGGLGVDNNTVYFNSANRFAWSNSVTGDRVMHLTSSSLTVNGTFVSSSDRNLKENIERVDSREILAKVAALPIARWNYKSSTQASHVGPMAQDFHAAFAVGPDDKHISMVDADGVALAAIQGLNEKVEGSTKKAELRLDQLEAENAELKRQLAEIKRLLAQLSNAED